MSVTKTEKIKVNNIAEIPSYKATNRNEYEEPEGLDQNRLTDWGDYPIDSLLIRSEPRTIFEVIRRIKNDAFVLNPDFQRDFVWDEVKQSRLIESVLMRIPLPVFYLAEQEDGKVVVVDGLQRLVTFNRYLNNDFALKGLKHPGANLNGKKFKDLISKFQNRIEDTNLILYIIDSKVPERARLDIFERVNSGVPLSRQQMRNSLYLGKATIWLREESKKRDFLEATGRSLNPKTMRDRELINRFCGFYIIGVDKYKGDMDDFLAQTLIFMNKKMTKENLKELSFKFQTSMKNNYIIFQQHSFRKHYQSDQARSVINASLFDVFSVILADYQEDFVKEKIDRFHERFYELINNDNFNRAITLSTNSLRRVKERFNIIRKTMKDI